MPRYSAFVELRNGHYREVDEVFDTSDPRGTAQRVVDSGVVEADDGYPIILVVEEAALSLFTCDRLGRVATPAEDIRRRIAEERDMPPLRVLADETDSRGNQ